MIVIHRSLSLTTTEPIQLLDITQQVTGLFEATGIQEGLLSVGSPHTTALINLNEREPHLQADMVEYLRRLVPRDGDYRHNLHALDGRDNAHAHLMGLSMNASETVPIGEGKLLLGDWQSIFFVELDGPRPSRQVQLLFIGQ